MTQTLAVGHRQSSMLRRPRSAPPPVSPHWGFDNVKLKPNGLTLRSKPYWTSADLYNDKATGLKLNTRYAKLKFSDPPNKKAYGVSVIGSKPADVAFATEHILEVSGDRYSMLFDQNCSPLTSCKRSRSSSNQSLKPKTKTTQS